MITTTDHRRDPWITTESSSRRGWKTSEDPKTTARRLKQPLPPLYPPQIPLPMANNPLGSGRGSLWKRGGAEAGGRAPGGGWSGSSGMPGAEPACYLLISCKYRGLPLILPGRAPPRWKWLPARRRGAPGKPQPPFVRLGREPGTIPVWIKQLQTLILKTNVS